ncbi:MAG: biotin-dependent carboxyltransferase family protein [Xanthobacteraceae bacterium]|nr:biotin-dependent carboxyltransferase family protein [Xanthobacteraceae bacterium]
MTMLAVIAADPATSVQDGGRHGAQRFGLSPSGAMDAASLALANALVGNPPLAAAIEVGPFGAAFAARDGSVRVALAGAQRHATLAGAPIAAQRSFVIAEHETLTLGPARDGVFSYLAIEGAVHGVPVFGSLSVNVRAGLGSPFPRGLEAGDVLQVDDIRPLRSERGAPPIHRDAGPIRVIAGPQDDEFEPAAMGVLIEREWMLAAASDRMGYRLEGPPLRHPNGHNIVSDGTVTGSIQVPGSGQPIVLMADRGTTGGYPKIATVISIDIGRLAQVRPGQSIRFALIGVEEALRLARRHAADLAALPGRITEIGEIALDVASLQDANLAGVAVSAVDAATWQAPGADAGGEP